MPSVDNEGNGSAYEINKSPSGPSLTAEQILEIFEPSFMELKEYLLPIVGSTAFEAIFRNAIRENKGQYPFLTSLSISASGLNLEVLKKEPIPPSTLLQSIFLLMRSIIELLTELTGNVLANKAKLLVSEMANQLEDNPND